MEMNRSDLIDKYIQKRANAEELALIKRLMEEDADFKEDITFQLELQHAVKKEESKKLKQQLQDFEQKKKSNLFIWTIWKIAAVVIIGLGALWFFNAPPDHEKIYAKNFEPYPNIVAPIVRNSNTPKHSMEDAFRFYDHRDYTTAAEAFKTMLNSDETGYANFYYAMSLMANGQVEKAIEALENPTWDVPEKFQNQVDWYLALGYLKTHNNEKAIQRLEKVSKTKGMMATKADAVLAQIK